MRIEISVERCSDDPSLCRGYIDCKGNDGKEFTLATVQHESVEKALLELLNIFNNVVKNIRFNLKAIAKSKAL